MSFVVAYITNENERSARKLSDLLINRKLAACTNQFPITSAYWWKGEIEHSNEVVLIAKTTTSKWIELLEFVERNHPYDVPCIMKFEVEANEAYERWIEDSVR